MSTLAVSQESVILGRVLRPERGDLPRETAQWLLDVDFDPTDRTRIAALYEKAREGVLTEDENAELEDYGDVGRLLEMLKAKARASLRKAGLERVLAERLSGPFSPLEADWKEHVRTAAELR